VEASTTPATPEAAPEESDTVLCAEHEALLADLDERDAQLAQLQRENADLRAQVQEANEVLAATRREHLALEEERTNKARALREMLGDHVRHVVGYDEGHHGQDTSLLVFWAGSSLFAWRAFPSEESLNQEEVEHTVWELQRELLTLRTGQEALTRAILGDELSEQGTQARSRTRLDTEQGAAAPPSEAPRLPPPGHVRMRVKRGNVVLSMGTRSAADGAFDVPAWEVEGMDNTVVEILARG
jgi:hypothetical protein